MLKNKNAFTLGEVLIVLALFGALAAMLLPAISNIRPNKSKVMFKKAYYTAERMVYELVNDEDLYPSEGDTTGLSNVSQVTYLGVNYGDATNETKQKSKFCNLFAKKVNTADDEIHCDETHATPNQGTYKEPSFVTTDGVAWYMPYSKFKVTKKTDGTYTYSHETIYVDTNGSAKPNCYKEDATATNPTSGSGGELPKCTEGSCGNTPYTCSKPDIFRIKVDPDGKMFVDGEFEKKYLKSNNSSRNDG